MTNEELAKDFRACIKEMQREYIPTVMLPLQPDAKAIVKERLEGYNSMHAWLRSKGVKERDITISKIVAHRQAWLVMLAEEFERKTLADTFKAALPLLYGGVGPQGDKFRYICHAIGNSMVTTVQSKKKAIEIVMGRLGYESTLTLWLRKQGVPWEEHTVTKIQRHRKAWLEMLVKEFSGETTCGLES